MNEKIIKVFDIINSSSALTVEQGDLLYSEIVSALRNKEDNIIIDFSDIESIITPFLNASIGHLYKDYTSDTLNKCLKIINQPEGAGRKFNMVIKNAKNFYSNENDYREIVKRALGNE